MICANLSMFGLQVNGQEWIKNADRYKFAFPSVFCNMAGT